MAGTTPKLHKYEVILNAGAMGIAQDENVKTIEATRFVRNENNNSVTFFDGEDEVAYFQFPTSISRVAS